MQEQEERGPETVILRVVSATTGEVMEEVQYQLGRRERRDATTRIPSGVNLALGGV